MASRGLLMGVGVEVVLAILGIGPASARPADLVVLKKWADEGVLLAGRGMGADLVQLIAEAEWDTSASRDPASYLVRVTFPDGRVDTRPFPVDYPPGRPRFAVYILADPIRGLMPSAVKVDVAVINASTGAPVSNTLTAGIEQIPRPKGDASGADNGPFGWGKPLDGSIRILPNPGPDGLRFASIAGPGGLSRFFLATTEASVDQVGRRLKGYDPKAGRSDEFALEGPAQPALNLTVAKATQYLEALGQSDTAGVTYRLPTIPEWSEAARSGKSTAFWWGDEPTFPAGANLLGPEPAQPVDATSPAQPPEASPTFEVNPFGLAHTFGNVAEWAVDPAGGFARMGGHFRTEPASPLPLIKVEKDDDLGPDAFVGVRPAAILPADQAAGLIRGRLAGDPRLAGVTASYDPDRALVTLKGSVAEPAARRSADGLLEGLWYVAAVDNRLETSTRFEGQLATLGASSASARRFAVLDRTFVEVPLTIRWLDPLPVAGTAWWINVYLPNGGHQSQKLDPADPGRSSKVIVRVDRSPLEAAGLPDTTPFRVALSIAGPAPSLSDPKVVTNAAEVSPRFAAPRPSFPRRP